MTHDKKSDIGVFLYVYTYILQISHILLRMNFEIQYGLNQATKFIELYAKEIKKGKQK